MRQAFPQNIPDYLHMAVVERTIRAAREMLRFGAWLKPRKYRAAKARRDQLAKQAQSAQEPEAILLRSVMAELYPDQQYPKRYPQAGGRWGVAVYRRQGCEWSLLQSRLYIPMTLRVLNGSGDSSQSAGVYLLLWLLDELAASGPPPSAGVYTRLTFPVEGVFGDVAGIAFTEDPELDVYVNDLAGLTFLAVVDLNSKELDQADKFGIDAVLRRRRQQDRYLVFGSHGNHEADNLHVAR
jgi:hypothetical protein